MELTTPNFGIKKRQVADRNRDQCECAQCAVALLGMECLHFMVEIGFNSLWLLTS
jgi:hypothetical protein